MISLLKVSSYAALSKVQLFIQELFPSPSQMLIQTPAAWISVENENNTMNDFLKFDKVKTR